MPSLKYGTTTIEYSLQRKAKKNDVTIAVEWSSGVSVVAPLDMSQDDLEVVIRKKGHWILKKLIEFREINDLQTPLEFLSGEKIQYLGRRYRLKVHQLSIDVKPELKFMNNRFVATIPSSIVANQTEILRNLCVTWLKNKGHEKLQERVKYYSNMMSLSPSQLVVKDQEKRWGSCTKNGAILINWRIMMAPMRVVDYVVVHELAHLKYHDHSSDFWKMIQSVMPDYEQRKEWLRINGPTLQL
ncbi:M48 family metallopeptidase [Paenibacillus ehimensis]|uniref:SprT family zinc-dependent metalloprotease n=1 Tax=Paenibacillus ehimensis TaxID=79264 RepID=A0ABT8VC53_9BACL|nr:SprT family zinc-dependent metalloprotease [Paenibacillus ehimensis]MDO3678558.1 SprT family zinc-dependent metalloprotease [Paenibacillus ehimensis]